MTGRNYHSKSAHVLTRNLETTHLEGVARITSGNEQGWMPRNLVDEPVLIRALRVPTKSCRLERDFGKLWVRRPEFGMQVLENMTRHPLAVALSMRSHCPRS